MKKILTFITSVILILGISTVFVSAEKYEKKGVYSIEIPEGYEDYSEYAKSSDYKYSEQKMWMKIAKNDMVLIGVHVTENTSHFNMKKADDSDIKKLKKAHAYLFNSQNYQVDEGIVSKKEINGYTCLCIESRDIKQKNSDYSLASNLYIFSSTKNIYFVQVVSNNESLLDSYEIQNVLSSFEIKDKLFMNLDKNTLYLIGIVMATALLMIFFIIKKNSEKRNALTHPDYFNSYSNTNNSYGNSANAYNSGLSNTGEYNTNTYTSSSTYSNTVSNNYPTYNQTTYNTEKNSIGMDSISADSYNSYSRNSQNNSSTSTPNNDRSDWLSSNSSSSVDVNKLADEFWNDRK